MNFQFNLYKSLKIKIDYLQIVFRKWLPMNKNQ